MSFGFEVFRADGSLMLGSDSIAYLVIDSIQVSHPNSGSRVYSDLPGGMTLEAQAISSDAVFPASHSGPGEFLEFAEGKLVVTVSGGVVSWQWQDNGNGKYNYKSATILVFGR